MGLKFKQETVEHRFTWDKGGEEECEFVVQQPSARVFAKLSDQNTKYKWDGPPGGSKRQRAASKQRFSEMDHEGFMDDKVDYIIKSWGVQGADGKVLPCTRENKIAFDNGRPDITNWIYEQLDELQEGDKEVDEEEEKNLGNS